MSNRICSQEALNKLRDAVFKAQYLIKIYASSQELRPEVLSSQLSGEIDVQDLQWLIRQFEMADFSKLPAIEVQTRLALSGAWSHYASEVNVIYLAGDFVENTPKERLITMLLQETICAMRKFVTEG